MPPATLSTSSVIRTRQTRRSRARRSPILYLGWGLALFFSLVATILVFTLTWGYVTLMRGLPSVALLPLLLDGAGSQLRQPTRLMDHTGKQVIGTLQDPNAAGSNYLLLEALPASLITITLATTDPDFWSHPGYPGYRGDGGYSLGEDLPTLAQRLAADLLLWDEAPSLRRQLRQSLLAGQATSRFGRKKILEWYLNSAPYGPGVYGVDAAARAYLGKSATEINLAEAAFLVAAAERPAIHPVKASELTLQRQQEILQSLRSSGLISPEDGLRASQETFELRSPAEPASAAPEFTDLVLQQLSTQFPIERLERGGLTIITSLDLDLQTQTTCAVQAQLASGRAATAPDCAASRLLPTLSTLPSSLTPGLDGAAIILDPQTGQILALVGQAAESKHPGGSLLTPFIYLLAYARSIGPASLAWDVPGGQPGVENFDGGYHGPVRLRIAFANDYLIPAAQLYEQVGAADVRRTMGQFGLDPQSEVGGDDFAAFLAGRVSLLDAAHSLSAFANQGALAGRPMDATPELHPVSVLRLESVDGRLWLDWSESQRRPVVGAQLAYLQNHVLSDETARWPSLGHPNSLEIGRPAAVKLSQTLAGNDTWAVGAIPQRMVGVWVGRADDENAGNRLPTASAAAIWHALVQYAGRELPAESWEAPPGVVSLAVCDPSGLLPTIECPNVVNEVFLSGNEPTRLDDLYRSVPINRVTGLLATVFTPPSLVEERVYLTVPPGAADWAQQAGLPIPPASYDIISPPPANPTVHIISPANFDSLHGVVELRGSAAGDDFDSYRLLVGAGLNPQRWLQIGEDSRLPVKGGVLGTWDASALSGLYAIQLQVVREDQQVETAILQVTVDNLPPEVYLLAPLEDQPVEATADGYVILQAAAEDDLSLARVEFRVDDTLIGALYPQSGKSGPYTLAWKAILGEHRLQVTAFDRAGNSSQVESTFEIGPP